MNGIPCGLIILFCRSICLLIMVNTSPPVREHSLQYLDLSHDVASGSEITLCNKIDKPLVVYRFTGSGMTSITTQRTK